MTVSSAAEAGSVIVILLLISWAPRDRYLTGRHKQKDRPRAAFCIPIGQGDQATLSAVLFCFRRYAMKPRPKNPRIIMAQVEGSGTPVT